jgi:hypothetical protein
VLKLVAVVDDMSRVLSQVILHLHPVGLFPSMKCSDAFKLNLKGKPVWRVSQAERDQVSKAVQTTGILGRPGGGVGRRGGLVLIFQATLCDQVILLWSVLVLPKHLMRYSWGVKLLRKSSVDESQG